MLKKITKRIYNKLKSKYISLRPFPTIIKPQLGGKLNICHISAFGYGNAGDTYLPIVLRDLFNNALSVKKWNNIHVCKKVEDATINKINHSDIMVIGGGGLFLKDTNRNDISGWQWPCSIEALSQIQQPIIMFAVGYNRFRGQEEFEPYFTDNINAFVEKASFVGLRNHGSIEAVKMYLHSKDLKNKLVYQPCMTTLTAKLYPDIVNYNKKDDFIAFNCAFDRQELRSCDDRILNDIAYVAYELSKITKIKYYAHAESDCIILQYFDKLNFDYEVVRFKNMNQLVEDYSSARLVVGMRGHAQMIPFGCQTPILSIISHDKMQWFLDDIGHSDWGVDVLNSNFKSELLDKVIDAYKNYEARHKDVVEAQLRLWNITQANLEKIKKIIQ